MASIFPLLQQRINRTCKNKNNRDVTIYIRDFLLFGIVILMPRHYLQNYDSSFFRGIKFLTSFLFRPRKNFPSQFSDFVVNK